MSCPPELSRREVVLASLAMSAAASLAPAFAGTGSGTPLLPPLPALPVMTRTGYVKTAGARIWYGRVGAGAPILLLHGGMASSRSWALQVPPLVAAGHEVILVDSRGHGRSTLGRHPLTYDLLANDIAAVIASLDLDAPGIAGWSDGAITALLLATRADVEVGRIFAFGANMTLAGVRPDADDAPILAAVGPRLLQDYRALSPTPDEFATLRDAVRAMQKQIGAHMVSELAAIRTGKVMIAAGKSDEFIKPEHPGFLQRHIPGAYLRTIEGTGHFAPWEKAELFNSAMIGFLSVPESGR